MNRAGQPRLRRRRIAAAPPPIDDRPGKLDRRALKRRAGVDETTAIKVLECINRRVVESDPGTARRAQHRKHHGCVKATFEVLEIEEPHLDLRQGLFAKRGKRHALIRFSNGLQDDDRRADSHGMAIKVLDVDGTKLLEGREHERAQDFILADHETFPSGDPKIMVRLNRILSGRGQSKFENVIALLLTHPLVLLRSLRSVKKVASLLDTSYFSAAAYRLGDHAVKYVVEPCGRTPRRAGFADRDFLARELAERLKPGASDEEPIRFVFSLDVRTDADAQPIEDPSVRWSRVAGHRRVPVAEIVIERQDLCEANGLAENLAFSPWHALREHEPLGFIGRARRDVYRALACRRHQLNDLVPYESSEVPNSYRSGRPTRFSKLYWDAPPLSRLRRLWKFLQQQLSSFANRHEWIIAVVERIGPLQRAVNRATINFFSTQTVQRPLPLSLWNAQRQPVKPADLKTRASYVSWSGLTNRSFTGRHLPPMCEADVEALPQLCKIERLFKRESFKPSTRTSALFCFFAQWLSDSFLRTHPDDTRRNTSNHDLDLCQIYGLGQESTRWLRASRGGLLKSRFRSVIGEMPPRLVNQLSLDVKREFACIAFDPVHATNFDQRDPPHGIAANLRELLRNARLEWAVEDYRWRHFYAGGLERANSTILYSAFNTVFLREHNRLARALRNEYCTDDNDWLFETARNINLTKYMKILIEDYINHLTGSRAKVRIDPGFADNCHWYRTNRISLEFNLLYRWHSLVPTRLKFEHGLAHREFRFDNRLIERLGIEPIIDRASRLPAGRVGLHNTPHFLVKAEVGSVSYSRQHRLAGFNAYRQRWSLHPYESFEALTGTDTPEKLKLARELRCIYGREETGGLERLELPVGLFAEDRSGDAVLPILLSLMVASDAFSLALTNPLLAAYIHGNDSITELGMREVDRVSTLADIVRDNCAPGVPQPLASFALPEKPKPDRPLH